MNRIVPDDAIVINQELLDDYRRLLVIEERYRNLKEAVYDRCQLCSFDISKLYIDTSSLETYLRICDWERYEVEVEKLQKENNYDNSTN